MPERPLVLFPQYSDAERKKLPGGGGMIHKPEFTRQISRVQPQLQRLQTAMVERRARLQQSALGIEPEYALVFETAGSPDSFITAIRNLSSSLEGLEWLFDIAIDHISSDADFYEVNKHGERKDGDISGKIYCVMTDQRALDELLSLWGRYIADHNMRFPRGITGLKHVFDHLRDIRPWGIEERLEETGVLQAWEDDLNDTSLDNVIFEIELFFRKVEGKRNEAVSIVAQQVQNLGGRIIGNGCCLSEITYHALMAELPRNQIERIINREEVDLVKVDNIMFFRPSGQMAYIYSDDKAAFEKNIEFPDQIINEPIIALLDGLPQANHPHLNNLLIIDDPENWSQYYQVNEREHGTAMASLIAYGDLNINNRPLGRKLYVRPIMKPIRGLNRNHESVPSDVLLVDMIHKCLTRMFEDREGAVARSVRIINFSIGDSYRPFINTMSPLARLFDWLSYKYGVLFIISAGNHNSSGFETHIPFEDLRQMDVHDREKHIIRKMNENSRHTRILSPAESMNSLTIGSAFHDGSEYIMLGRQIMPFEDILPSPISALGRGYNNSIKPDLIYSGGRKRMVDLPMNPSFLRWVESPNSSPGCLAAAPFDLSGGAVSVTYSHGTSNATALTSHEAVRCFETLAGVFASTNGESVPYEYTALLVKAMLIHGASWNNLSVNTLKDALGLHGRGENELHKWIGYGLPDTEYVHDCTNRRVTLLGYGSLEDGRAHIYQLPLPFNFSRRGVFRKVAISLAYFTPTIQSNQQYRAAQLWFSLEEEAQKLTPDRCDADWQAVRRGTLQHEVFTGESAYGWNEAGSYDIRVNCREDAGPFVGAVPYALVVSFEAAEGLATDIYSEVVAAIRARTVVTPRPH